MFDAVNNLIFILVRCCAGSHEQIPYNLVGGVFTARLVYDYEWHLPMDYEYHEQLIITWTK